MGLLHYSLSYAHIHMNSFIFQVKYSRYLRYDFRVWDYVDLVWLNIYCNRGKVMFIKKTNCFLYTSLSHAVDCFPSPAVFVCWMVAYIWRLIQQWRIDLHNIHGTEQLLVLAPLIYYGEELLFWMLFSKKVIYWSVH